MQNWKFLKKRMMQQAIKSNDSEILVEKNRGGIYASIFAQHISFQIKTYLSHQQQARETISSTLYIYHWYTKENVVLQLILSRGGSHLKWYLHLSVHCYTQYTVLYRRDNFESIVRLAPVHHRTPVLRTIQKGLPHQRPGKINQVSKNEVTIPRPLIFDLHR